MLKLNTSVQLPKEWQSRLEIVKHGLKPILNDHPEFYYELTECYFDFYEAIQKKRWEYATTIVEKFYVKWVAVDGYNRQLIWDSILPLFTSLCVMHLAVQLAYVTHYPLFVTYQLVLLQFSVGIKIATPHWVASGTLSHGLFAYRITRARIRHARSVLPACF